MKLESTILMILFAVGLVVLAGRLKALQVDGAPGLNYVQQRQSIRRVQTAGLRGRILDAHGRVLAGSRLSLSIVCDTAEFQRRTWSATAEAIGAAATRVGEAIGRPTALTARDIRRHVDSALAMPLYLWRDLNDEELARFTERAWEFPGFKVVETEERHYPEGDLAAHVIGYVGRDRGEVSAGDVKFSFAERELRGRAGLEYYYDGYLRGVPGELELLVDARGFGISSRPVTKAGRGPDLALTLDADIQRLAQRVLAGKRGACVVLEPRNGGVLAMASAPDYDLNALVPLLSTAQYRQLMDDAAKPLLNRATAGSYAPGSTFKPVTAVAALELGVPTNATYVCDGSFRLGGMTLHCTRPWGHGALDLVEAIRVSCNPYFCNLGCEIGTNALCRTARAFGLGAKTGIDTPDEVSGVVPDQDWKMRTYGEPWYPGDLAQMSIGQGMLLTTPLQMACVAAALGTGRRVTPRLRADAPVQTAPLPFSARALDIVREGMRRVVEPDGTGARGAEGVDARVIGKTGTAEVGRGATRRKNTWFIAYAEKASRAVAVALVIEDGESGGRTAAPRVAEILRGIFGERHV